MVTVVLVAGAMVTDFVAQIVLRSDVTLPQTDSAYWHGTRYAESFEAV